MSYTPTVWKTGDVVSSEKLNKIETELVALDTAVAVLEPTATSSDVGKALKVKTVSDGKVTEYEFGETGSSDAAPVIVDTATGAIASFPDGAGGMPFRKVVAEIEPVQDLHGYDAPWPAGGGKNLLYPSQRTVTSNGVTYTANEDGSITLTGTATGDERFTIMLSDTSTFPNPSSVLVTGGVSGVNFRIGGNEISSVNGTLTLTTEVVKNSAAISVTNETVTNCTIKIQVESGSTIPTQWTPYSNVCPISGHTGVDVNVTGHNVWDEEWENGYIDANGNNAPSSAIIRSKNYIPVKGGQSYCFHITDTATMWMSVTQYDADKNFISQTSVLTNYVMTLDANTKYVRFYASSAYGDSYNNDISINYPSTDTEYHSYNGNSYSVTWETEAGTVYGGTLTVNEDGSGSVTATQAEVDMGDIIWNADPNRPGVFYGAIPNTYPARKNMSDVIMGSCYKVENISVATNKDMYISGVASYGGTTAFVRDTRFASSTAAEYKTAIAGEKYIYEIATPTTYQLTQSQVITALQGQNNIWASTGDVTVNYPADTKLYIDKKIAAAVAALS